MGKFTKYLSLVKFWHTIFAMPFAMIGFFSANALHGAPITMSKLLLVVLAMIFARNAAMAYNRYADRDIDIKNPRTAGREIPSGVISPVNAIIFVVINSLAFILVAYFINELCFHLSPLALTVILSYSHFKRYSALCHTALGISLSIAPVGASLALLGELTNFPIYLAGIVLCWVAGFDILYSLQDSSFDKENNLNSVPALFGIKGGLLISTLFHAAAIVGVFALGLIFNFTTLYYIGASVFSLILIWEHIIVTPKKLSRINLAFATLNGLASVIYATFTILSFYFSF